MARDLTARERDIAARACRDYLTYYDAHPADARKLVETGESDADSSLPPARLAAVTMLANQLLNLDEVPTK